MRAIHMKAYGGLEVLELAEAATPEPAPGQARIKVVAVGVNPADWKWRAGWFQQVLPLTFPHIPGYDVAGVVDALGDGVTDLKLGDRVAVNLPPHLHGAYAEYVVAPSSETARIPSDLDFATAAALPTPALTGDQLVREHLAPTPGQTVLVTGAVGGVGRFALHAAKQLGARVVAAVRARHAEEARALGADEVIELGEAYSGAPFDMVADTVGGPEVAALCRHVKVGGKIGTVSTTPIDPAGLPAPPVFIGVHADRAGLEALAAAVARGEVKAPIAKRLALAQAATAQQLVEAGGLGGKVVLEP